jgi:hypothetical protein
MRHLTECPFCNAGERTPIAEFNSLILLDKMRDDPVCRYAYALCHGCGVLYATRRPEGDEYTFIYDNFNEFLGRAEITDLLNYPGPLSEEVIAAVDKLAIPWWKLKEKYSKDDPLRSLRSAIDMEQQQVAHIVSAIDVKDFRVLEIRAKTGYALDVLKRKYGARELCATVLFPVNEYALEKLYPIDAEVGINFETLDIPFDPPFDLIIATHLLTHALDPRQLFQYLHSYVAPGGYVLFCRENDDEALCAKGKNLVSELRCFHFQQFDREGFRRAVAGNGFEPLFVKLNREGGKDTTMVCLARRLEKPASASRMDAADLERRLAFYRKWLDESVLILPDGAKAMFSDLLGDIEKRALEGGYAKREGGKVSPIRQIRTYNKEGYTRLNEESEQRSDLGAPLGPRFSQLGQS